MNWLRRIRSRLFFRADWETRGREVWVRHEHLERALAENERLRGQIHILKREDEPPAPVEGGKP